MEIQQFSTELKMGLDRNQERNLKVFRIEWKWDTICPKLWETMKAVLKSKLIALSAYTKILDIHK